MAMTELSYPGVYVNEITPAPGPIQGVSTSTAAFVGVTASGPDGVSVVTNFTAFKKLFGVQDGTPDDLGFLYLANAVFGFFNNGGSRAYVTRVAATATTSPQASMKTAATAYSSTEVTTSMTAAQADAVLKAISGEVPQTPKSRAGVTANAPTAVSAAVKSVMTAWSDTDCLGAATAMITAAQGAVSGARDALLATDITSGLTRLLPFDDISIVAAPGLTSSTQWGALQTHCSTAAPNRFAVLDSPAAEDWADQATPSVTLAALQANSSSAVYFPWVWVIDPITGIQMPVPPSGHMAGVYARVDATRGVFKAPANEPVLGVLHLDSLITNSQQGTLNADGTCVNCLRRLNGSILVWGARTAKWTGNQLLDAPFRYLSTRRTFNYIRASLESGTQWAVFEPNNNALWGKINRNVTSFLTKLWQAGGLVGDTAAQAFYVKCDEETNPPDSRAIGQVVTEVGVAITLPAEFVVFNLGVITQSPS